MVNSPFRNIVIQHLELRTITGITSPNSQNWYYTLKAVKVASTSKLQNMHHTLKAITIYNSSNSRE